MTSNSYDTRTRLDKLLPNRARPGEPMWWLAISAIIAGTLQVAGGILILLYA